MNPIEIWKDVEGYGGDYKISNMGRIISCKYGRESYMCPAPTQKGYLRIKLCKLGILKTYSVHALVLENFSEKRPAGLEANHIDGVKTNNCIFNLEWVTASQNTIHSFKILGKELANKAVSQYSSSGVFITSWKSIAEAGRKTNILSTSICACCNKRRKSAGGYIWKFAEVVN